MAYLPEIQVSARANNHFSAGIIFPDKAQSILPGEFQQVIRASQDIFPKGMAFENILFQDIVNFFGRIILVRIYFIKDNILLFL